MHIRIRIAKPNQMEEQKFPEVWRIEINRPVADNLKVLEEVKKIGFERQMFKSVWWPKHLNSDGKYGKAGKKMIDVMSRMLESIASLASCKVLHVHVIYSAHGFVEWHDDVVNLGAGNGSSWDFAIHHQLRLEQDKGLLNRHMPLLSNLVTLYMYMYIILLLCHNFVAGGTGGRDPEQPRSTFFRIKNAYNVCARRRHQAPNLWSFHQARSSLDDWEGISEWEMGACNTPGSSFWPGGQQEHCDRGLAIQVATRKGPTRRHFRVVCNEARDKGGKESCSARKEIAGRYQLPHRRS